MDEQQADGVASGAGTVNTSIVSDLQVLGGKPCIRGTRISVDLLVEMVTHGATLENILDAYAHLRREDVEAALRKAGVTPPEEPPTVREPQRGYRGSSYSRR
jgi:uncharacterized protein (DUF433 family)